jgi:hypothetical protein
MSVFEAEVRKLAEKHRDRTPVLKVMCQLAADAEHVSGRPLFDAWVCQANLAPQRASELAPPSPVKEGACRVVFVCASGARSERVPVACAASGTEPCRVASAAGPGQHQAGQAELDAPSSHGLDQLPFALLQDRRADLWHAVRRQPPR